MPVLDGKHYKYDKKGKAAHARDLVKKLKKKRKSSYGYGDQDQNGDTGGE